MSNYAQTPSYGANPNPPYLAPAYLNQYLQPNDSRTSQGHMESNYDTSVNAYGYNRSAPAFSAVAVASGVPPLPIFQGWNQDAVPLPPYTTPQNGGQYTGYGSNLQSQQYYPPPAQPSYQQLPHTHQNKPFEQDLSEGEFEDSAVAGSAPTIGYGATQYRGNDGTGYVDTAQRAVYPRAPEYSPQQPYPTNNYNYPPRDNSQARRQQSDSYSPYASPSVPNNVEQPSGAPQQSSYPPDQSQEVVVAAPLQSHDWPQKSANLSEPKMSMSSHVSSQKGESVNQNATGTSQSTHPLNMNGTGSSSGKSVAESRKKAQGAILSLWHYDVRFQTYIDEGFKKDLIEPLFVGLNLSRTALKSGSSTHHAGESWTSQFQQPRQGNSATAAANATFLGSKTSQDAIAPLSVTTNGNLAMKATLPQTPTDQVKTTATSAPAKSVSMIEKDKALKSKMDALRKSREDRAQKAAAKTGPSSVVSAVTSVISTVPADQQEQLKVVVHEAAASEEEASVQAMISLSRSPGAQSDNLPLDVETSLSVAKEQATPEPATKPASIQHQLPLIPGLFLASTAASPAQQAPTQSATQTPIHINQRKRPVAADFDEPVSSMTLFKRPFGQSRNDKPLVIDISEEEIDSEDEDVAMDLESVPDESPRQSTGKPSEHLISNTQSVSTNLTQPKPWSPPSFSSAASTPPSAQQGPRSTLGRPEMLQRKESEIEELKKKIAEAEAKRKSKLTPSGARTPRSSEAAGAGERSAPQTNEARLSQLIHSTQMQQLVESEDTKIADTQQDQADVRDIESAQASELKRIAAEQKRLRRIKVASDLAALKAADEQEVAEIERRKAEVATMEATRRTALEIQQRMMDEMLLLTQDDDENEGQNSSWAQHERLVSPIYEAKVDRLLDLNLTSVAHTQASPKPISPASEQDHTSGLTASPTDISEELSASSNTNTDQPGQINHVSTTEMIEHATLADETLHHGHVNGSEDRTDDTKAGKSADQALEAALQEAVRIEADSHVHTEEDTDMDLSNATKIPQPVLNLSSEPNDEVPISPEYSPELHRSMPDLPDRESDDYEPPEATPPPPPQDFDTSGTSPKANSPSPADSPPFSPAPPADVSESSEDLLSGLDFVKIPAEKASEMYSEQLPLSDEILPQLVETRAEQADHLQSFTPYESPLKHFHAYRFHPQFKQEIPGGLKSMTYSHRINPNKELCRFELAGGICNDSTCDLQHFRDIGLPDDAVLTALGSPDEFQGEQRDRFCVGLKEVLLKLRVNKVRDFNIIASEIIAHRVKFLGDNSKVLPLEGTSI